MNSRESALGSRRGDGVPRESLALSGPQFFLLQNKGVERDLGGAHVRQDHISLTPRPMFSEGP